MQIPPQVLLTISAMFWGGNAVASKLAVGHLSPMLLTFCRWTLASMVLGLFCHRRVRHDWHVINERKFYLLSIGALGFAIFNGFLYSAAHYIGAINIAIEQAAIPLVIFIVNYALYRHAATRFQVIGYVLTLIGVLLTTSDGHLFRFAGLGLGFGDFLMLLASIVFAIYSVMLRKKPDIHWSSFTFMLMAGASLASMPMLLAEYYLGHVLFSGEPLAFMVLGYTALFPSLVAQTCYILGNNQLGANVAGLFVNLIPVFGAFFAVLILDEYFGWYHGLALLLVVGGITLSQRKTVAAT